MPEILKTLRKSVAVDKFDHLATIQTPHGLPFQFFLTESGDGLGEFNHNGDYSTTARDIYYEASTDYYIYSVIVNISDDDKFTQDGYGALASGIITNGVKFYVTGPGGTPETRLLERVDVTKNYHWSLMTPDINLISYEDTLKSARTLLIEFNIVKSYGTYLRLETGQRFMIRLNDNFSGLIAHTFGVRGILF